MYLRHQVNGARKKSTPPETNEGLQISASARDQLKLDREHFDYINC